MNVASSRLIGGVNPGMSEMYDQQVFLQTLSRFAVALPARYDLEATLAELTKSVVAVMGMGWCDPPRNGIRSGQG